MTTRLSAAAVIRITALADPGLNRALNGAVNQSRRAAKQIEADFLKSAKERERAEKKLAVVAAREAKAQARAHEQAEKYKLRVAEQGARLQIQMNAAALRDKERKAKQEQRIAAQTEREKQRLAEAAARRESQMHERTRREAERTARASIKEAQRVAREQERLDRQTASNRRRGLLTAGGAVVGGLVAGANAAAGFSSRASGALGVQDPADTIGSAKEITEGLIRSLGQAGFGNDFVQATIKQIDDAAKRNKVDQGGLAAALLKAQAKFSDPQFFLKNVDFFSQMSRATGAPVEQLTDFALGQRQIGGLTDAQTRDLVAAAFVQGGKGSIEFREMAGTFAPSIATFAQDVGATGLEEMMQIQGIVQVLAKSLKNPAEVATTLERFGSALKEKKTQKQLAALGVDIADEKGNIDRSPAEIVEMLASNKTLRESPQMRQKVFENLLGEGAAATLITRQGVDPNLLRSLTNVDPAEGLALAASINANLDASQFSKIDEMNISAQSVTLSAGNDLVEAFVKAAEARMGLATSNPVAFEASDAALQTLGGFGLGGILGRWFGGGGKVVGDAVTGGGAVAGGKALVSRAVPAVGSASSAALGVATAVTLGNELSSDPTVDFKGGPLLEWLGGLAREEMMSGGGGSAYTPMGREVDLSDETIRRIAEAQHMDPAKVTLEVKSDGRARATRIQEGDGLTVDVSSAGNLSMSLP